VAPSQQLDPFFEGLKYDGHRKIRFLRDKALFGDAGDVYRLEFFHPGWMFKKPVQLHDMGLDGKTKAVPFDPALFNYGELKVPENVTYPEGYRLPRARSRLAAEASV
jgi:glucans biosynthesis protein